jgi:hypothetical protein
MPFLWIHYQIAPAGSTRSASVALSGILEPQRQRSPNIIGRTSDDVDVLSNNGWQLLLCQITRGCNCRVVCWGLCTEQRLPCQIPSTDRHRCHGSTWSRSVFAKVMDARLVYWGAALWDGCITLCYNVIPVVQTPMVMRRIRFHRIVASSIGVLLGEQNLGQAIVSCDNGGGSTLSTCPSTGIGGSGDVWWQSANFTPASQTYIHSQTRTLTHVLPNSSQPLLSPVGNVRSALGNVPAPECDGGYRLSPR